VDAPPRRAWQHYVIALFVIALVAGFRAVWCGWRHSDDVAHHFWPSHVEPIAPERGRSLGLSPRHRTGRASTRFTGRVAPRLLSRPVGANHGASSNVAGGSGHHGVCVAESVVLVLVLCFALARPLLSATSALIQVITVELFENEPADSSTRHHLGRRRDSGAGLAPSTRSHSKDPTPFRWLFALGPSCRSSFLGRSLRRVPSPRFHGAAGAARPSRGRLPRERARACRRGGTVVFVIG